MGEEEGVVEAGASRLGRWRSRVMERSSWEGRWGATKPAGNWRGPVRLPSRLVASGALLRGSLEGRGALGPEPTGSDQMEEGLTGEVPALPMPKVVEPLPVLFSQLRKLSMRSLRFSMDRALEGSRVPLGVRFRSR